MPVDAELSNVVIRKAILAALDPNARDLRINQGAGDASSSLFFTKSVYSSDVPGPVFDAKLAASLVTQAKADGTWNGRIRLTCTTAQASQALAVLTALDAVGFDVEMQTAPATSDLFGSLSPKRTSTWLVGACRSSTPVPGSSSIDS